MEKAYLRQEEKASRSRRRQTGNGIKKGLKTHETANQHLPALALRGTTILPDMIVHFDVSRERSMKAIEAANASDEKIFLVTQKDPEIENTGDQGFI